MFKYHFEVPHSLAASITLFATWQTQRTAGRLNVNIWYLDTKYKFQSQQADK